MPHSQPHAPIGLRRRRAITAGLLLGMSLGALEATVVGTAMPTVVASLGGLAHYSWVFSAYLLTSTASVPIWGRLSDLYGRRRMYLLGVTIFLVGSAVSGASATMLQLIAARALQGLGAGAVVPLSQAIVGELYVLRERARAQALFSGVWGVASIAGPLVGGYITDALSWRWVFYINIPAGLLALAVIAVAYPPSLERTAVKVDWLGAVLLFTGVSGVLLALSADNAVAALSWGVASAVALLWFAAVERRIAEPILPVDLLASPFLSRAFGVVFLAGFALFGVIAFIPLFVQVVLGGTATQAGQVLTPLFLGWVITSVAGARATVRFGYRRVTITGGVLMTGGFIGLSLLTPASTHAFLLTSCFVVGSGMGFSMLSLLLAIQHSVVRTRLGIATSLNQFSRSIGAAVGVAAMGAIVARTTGAAALPGDVQAFGSQTLAMSDALRQQFAAALHLAFLAGTGVSALGLAVTLVLPPVHFGSHATSSAETSV
jgi:EmrB/QacA subfamily drug resistance transporter